MSDFDYGDWASQYAKTIELWGFIQSIADGWVSDLLCEQPTLDACQAHRALIQLS